MLAPVLREPGNWTLKVQGVLDEPYVGRMLLVEKVSYLIYCLLLSTMCRAFMVDCSTLVVYKGLANSVASVAFVDIYQVIASRQE